MPSISAKIWASLKPVPVITPAGQAATQVPQPLHRAALTSLTFRSSSNSMALYGHRSLQMRQPEQRLSSIEAPIGSIISFC